ncbi:MAG: glycoside hydrolase family 31 protein [Chloroflexota bacterium]
MREDTYFRQFRVRRRPTSAYEPIGSAQVVHETAGGLVLRTGDTLVEVTALASDLFRVGMFGSGRPSTYASEAVVKTDWQPDEVQIRKDGDEVTVSSGRAKALVKLNPLRISFEDDSGRRFAEDDPDMGMGFAPLVAGEEYLIDPVGTPSRVYKRHRPSEHYFGCGERTGGLEKTDSHQVFWNVDPPTQHTAALNNLYTSIPFLLVLDDAGTWGLFLDNTTRVEFDLAHEDPERSWFGPAGGDLVYYVFAGPTPAAVLDRYTELTGRTPMPPTWALGYHQSRWGYKTAEEVRETALELRAHDIPCDALYLDIDYMDGYRVFTWDRKAFPDPKGLVAELAEAGFRVVAIVDPGVKVDRDYEVYVAGRDADFYCKTFLGGEYRNVVWPGVCAFPDFTNPKVRDWWGDLHRGLVEAGVAGIWCDMNEPTGFIPTPMTMPPDVVHPGGGEPRLHAQLHNIYGSLMAKATREGLQRLRPDKRPFVISRSGYAGLQRHAMHWTGDNTSWWEHLWMSMPQLQNLGLSGLAWNGVDIGGFSGDTNGELLTRWVEFGIFQPFCRNHSAWDSCHQEPWVFGPLYEGHIRRMLKLRQRLVPYLYSLFYECHTTGVPILRPLLFEYPEDGTTHTTEDEFLLGSALLVAPISRRGSEYRHVYLPAGTWYHFWTGGRFHGPAHTLVHAPLGSPALYVKANSPVPLWPEMNYVGERPADPLNILVYPTEGEGACTLYEDAGDGYEHERGVYAKRRIACRDNGDAVSIEIGPQEGSFRPERTRVRLELRGFTQPPAKVTVDGSLLTDWHMDGSTLIVTMPATTNGQDLQIQRGQTLIRE